jgi:hypothetical protein
MPESKKNALLKSPGNPAAKLNKIGLMVLLAGLAVGGLIYALGGEDDSADENSLMSQYYKNQELATQRLWGNEGSLILGIERSLERPRTYSAIVIVGAGLFSFACFFMASHPLDHDEKQKSKAPDRASETKL